MASKSKDIPGEMERLERNSRIKIDNIRNLIHELGHAEDRVRCSNWLHFLSSSGKDEARVRNCLLDQMERQLRQGQLSQPFTTYVNNRTALHLLLDEEGRQRLSHASQPEMPSKDTISQKTTFIWQTRIEHLNTLEEQYRRQEQEQWLHEFPVALQSKEQTAIQDIGVQVELPPGSSRKDQAPKKQEIKKTKDQERQIVTERRQLDVQRREKARLAGEKHLLQKQLKVKERRDHERFLINKRREAQIPLKKHRTMAPSQRQKGVQVQEVKKVNIKSAKEPVPQPNKQVNCQKCHTANKCACSKVLKHQAVLRAEDVKKKVMAYQELKEYNSKKAVEERERLKMQQLNQEKAVLEDKQGRATAGENPLDRKTKQEEVGVGNVNEDRNQKESKRKRKFEKN
ncbi:polyamine-modulated factor 1-binding protein 1-like [Drosophila serrata]|uniref:polyamine-modulated factor 1-binding protein 1-like n=1 Tax=Drosophila serrata TaxID=7274 RepID=UPI000A1D3818|nr:polyamine-modulated factor 1-binding protein 1-like [Drosophila serrata]